MKKILIIEDEYYLGSTYQNSLVEAGYEAKWVKTINEAKKIASKFSADLLLLDHGFQSETANGIESIPEFKKRFPSSIIIIFSNYSDFNLKQLAFQKGAHDYWLKIGTSLEDLIRKVNLCLLSHNTNNTIMKKRSILN